MKTVHIVVLPVILFCAAGCDQSSLERETGDEPAPSSAVLEMENGAEPSVKIVLSSARARDGSQLSASGSAKLSDPAIVAYLARVDRDGRFVLSEFLELPLTTGVDASGNATREPLHRYYKVDVIVDTKRGKLRLDGTD